MAELRVRMIRNIGLDLLPVLVVAANTLAVAAHRQQAAKLLHVRQRGLQFRNALGQPFLQREHVVTVHG